MGRLKFLGPELDMIFDFCYLIEVENFVDHIFLSPNMIDFDDIPPMKWNVEFDNN